MSNSNFPIFKPELQTLKDRTSNILKIPEFQTNVQKSSAKHLPKVKLQNIWVSPLNYFEPWKNPNSNPKVFGPSLILHIISEDRPFCLPPAALHKRAMLLRKLGVADMRLAVKIFFQFFFCYIYCSFVLFFFCCFHAWDDFCDTTNTLKRRLFLSGGKT